MERPGSFDQEPPREVRERAEELRREINKHNYYYYVLDSPIISAGRRASSGSVWNP